MNLKPTMSYTMSLSLNIGILVTMGKRNFEVGLVIMRFLFALFPVGGRKHEISFGFPMGETKV